MDWSQYEAILAMRGESAAVRVSYLEGVLELMNQVDAFVPEPIPRS